MKSFSILLLPLGGFLLFAICPLLPIPEMSTNILMIIGAAMVLLFYFITLIRVIKTFSADPSRKIFWLIAVICVPVVGNIIYIIFREMANRRQKPHGVW